MRIDLLLDVLQPILYPLADRLGVGKDAVGLLGHCRAGLFERLLERLDLGLKLLDG